MEHGTLPEHLISGRRALMEHRNTGTTEWNAQRNSHMEQWEYHRKAEQENSSLARKKKQENIKNTANRTTTYWADNRIQNNVILSRRIFIEMLPGQETVSM